MLRDSLERLECDWPHYLVVQTEDLAKFAALGRRPHVTVLPTAEVLTPDMEKWRRRCLTPRSPGDVLSWAVRRRLNGWFSQQAVKLLAGRALGIPSWVCVDSDCVFLRAPQAGDFLAPDGSTALFEFVDFPVGESVRRFHRDAVAFLGLPASVDTEPTPRHTYVQQLIPLRADVVEQLLAWVEDHHAGPWWASMARARATEYTTYGLFARHVLDPDGLTPADRRLVRLFYSFDPGTFQSEVRQRFEQSPSLRAVMVHSTMGVSPTAYAHLVEPLIGRV